MISQVKDLFLVWVEAELLGSRVTWTSADALKISSLKYKNGKKEFGYMQSGILNEPSDFVSSSFRHTILQRFTMF